MDEERGRDEAQKAKVYVAGLNKYTTEEDLEGAFRQFGKIIEVLLKYKDSQTFAFISYESIQSAERAIQEMNRKNLKGSTIRVELARARKAFDSSGPRGDRGHQSFQGDRPRRDTGDRPRTCFNCNEEGHFARDCTKPKKPRDFENNNRGRNDNEDSSRRDRDARRERDRSDSHRKDRRQRDRSPVKHPKSRDQSRERNDRKDRKRRTPSSSSRSRSRSANKKKKQVKRKSSSSRSSS